MPYAVNSIWEKLLTGAPLGEADQAFLTLIYGDVKPPYLQSYADKVSRPGYNEAKNLFWGAWRLHFFYEVLVEYRAALQSQAESNLELIQKLWEALKERLPMQSLIPLDANGNPRKEWDDPALYNPDDYPSLNETDKLIQDYQSLWIEYEEAYQSMHRANIELIEQEILPDMIQGMPEQQQTAVNGMIEELKTRPMMTRHDCIDLLARHLGEFFEHVEKRYDAMYDNLTESLRPDYINSNVLAPFMRDLYIPSLALAMCACDKHETQAMQSNQGFTYKAWAQTRFMDTSAEAIKNAQKKTFGRLNQRLAQCEVRLAKHLANHPDTKTLFTLTQLNRIQSPAPHPAARHHYGL